LGGSKEEVEYGAAERKKPQSLMALGLFGTWKNENFS
jgi:hypothetical protein